MQALHRALLSPLSLILCSLLFWAIAKLIQNQPAQVHNALSPIRLDFLDKPVKEDKPKTNDELEETVQESSPDAPLPPEMSLALPALETETVDFSMPADLSLPSIEVPKVTQSLSIDQATGVQISKGKMAGSTGDRELMALRENALSYPPMAKRKRIEGWVLFNYLVDESGNVSDVEIVESSPPRVFDRVIIKEVSKWKYRPRLKGGKPVATRVIERKYVFSL